MSKPIEQLPHLDLSPDQEDRLKQYLAYVLDTADAERSGFINGLVEEVDAYEAPAKGRKTFPWRDAANMTVPLIGSMSDTIFPRLHATVYGSSTYVSIEEWPGELADHAKAWQDMLQWIMENELDIERVSDSWFMEAIIHGTSIVKLTWERLERVSVSYDDNDKIVKKDRKLIRNQPVLEHVPLEDFYIPFTARSISEAEWCAQRIPTTYGKLLMKERNGLYKNVEQIADFTAPGSAEYSRAREQIESTTPMFMDEYEIYEVWADFDLDDDGEMHPLLVTFHRGSSTLLRVQPNPYKHKRKPFREIVYFPRHDRFFGLGLARQLMPLQEEISTIHQQRIDSATIANTRMWKVVAGSRADQSFQGAAPGLKVLVDDITEIEPMEMGSPGMESYESEKVSLQYAQQRSGVTDFTTGIDFGKGGGRQTATQTVAMMQEARTRFNWTLEQVRTAIADVASMVTDLYAQFGQGEADKFRRVLGERAELVSELLRGGGEMEGRPLSAAMSLQVTASSASANKAIEQQNLLSLLQLMNVQTQNIEMPFIQIILNPMTPPPLRDYALEKIEGSRALLRRIMETADVRNAAEILGSMEVIESAVEATAGAAPVSGAAVPGQVPLGQPGMGDPTGAMAGPMGGLGPAPSGGGRGGVSSQAAGRS